MTAQYPNATGSDGTLFVLVNNLSTLLNGGITSGAGTITVVSTTGFPSIGYITIDQEAIFYTGKNATQFTGCSRGSDGTTAASHLNGATVYHNFVANHHNVLKDEIAAIEADLRASFYAAASTLASTLSKYLPATTAAATYIALTGNQTSTSGHKSFAGQLSGKGTPTNDNAPVGYIGETMVSATARSNFPATGVWGDLTSLALTAGDWLVWAPVESEFVATTITRCRFGISPTSGNSSTGLTAGYNAADTPIPTANIDGNATVGPIRLSLSGTTTYYLKYSSTYSGTVPIADGTLFALRIR